MATKGKITRYDAEAWVLGYITAYNVYVFEGEDVAKGVDAAGLLAWIDRYCATNPLDNIDTATMMLVRELQRRNSRPN